jgi:transposase
MTTTSTTQGEEQLLKVDCLGRVHTSGEQREAILEEFDRSGLPATRFAKLHGIKYQTFASWIQKRRRGQGDYPAKKKAQAQVAAHGEATFTLAEVLLQSDSPQPATASENPILIHLPCGVRIELNHGDQLPLLVELLNILTHKSSC